MEAGGALMAFEKINARLAELQKGIPDGTFGVAAQRVKARYLADSVSARGNTPYTPTDVQARGDSTGVRVTAPEWSMRIAHREGQPAVWGEIISETIRERMERR